MKNRLLILMSGVAVLGITSCTKPTYQQPDAPIQEVPFTQVHINDGFWLPRIETNRTVSIPSAFKECEKNGRFDNFAIAGGLKKGEHRGDFSFDDTDPYKVIEGASYSLAVKYDPQLDQYYCSSSGAGWIPDYLRDKQVLPTFWLVGTFQMGKAEQS